MDEPKKRLQKIQSELYRLRDLKADIGDQESNLADELGEIIPMLTCINKIPDVVPGCVSGRIDCARSEPSFEMRNSTGGVTLELSCSEPTTIRIWMVPECPDEDYISTVSGQTDFDISSGPGSVAFDSVEFPNNVYIYTPPAGLTNPEDVIFQWGSVDAENVVTLCSKTVPMGDCDTTAPDGHNPFNIGSVVQKSTLDPSGAINSVGTGTLVIEGKDFSGVTGTVIRAQGYDRLLVQNCCIPGTYQPNGAQPSFGYDGIKARACKQVEIYQNTISGFYDGINVDDCDQMQIEQNTIFDCSRHHLFSILCRNLVPGASKVRLNNLFFTVPIDSPTQASDVINIFNPLYQGRVDLLVEENFVYLYKGDNGSAIIFDGFMTDAFLANGTRLGGVHIRDNFTLQSIVQGVGITKGEFTIVEDNVDYCDLALPTAGGTSPTSGGVGFAVNDYVNPDPNVDDNPYPNFGNHINRNNRTFHIHTSGGEQRFFAQNPSAVSLSGNNYSGNGVTTRETPAPIDVDFELQRFRQKLAGLICYV